MHNRPSATPLDLLFRKFFIFMTILILLVLITTVPVAAGNKYLSGSPDLSAAVSGSNDFFPGQDVTIPVVLYNRGTIEYVFSYADTLSPIDLPNKAKQVQATLRSGDSPLIVRSDQQSLGDISGGDSVTANFRVTIPRNVTQKSYMLPLSLQYSYLMRVDQYSTDAQQNFYKTINTTILLPIQIHPQVNLQVLSVDPVNITSGSSGYLNLTMMNNGNVNGKESVIKISPFGTNPVKPTVDRLYIGDFGPGSSKMIQFQVSVPTNVISYQYPVNLSLQYLNPDGILETSDPVTIGIPVGGKIAFAISSPEQEIYPGGLQNLDITYQNTGSAPVYAAQVRIFTVFPFSAKDETSYLGDMMPGQVKTAHFMISVDSTAMVKDYGIDSEVQYRDSLDNDQVTDRISVPVLVQNRSIISTIISNPYYLFLLALAVMIVVYSLVKRNRENKLKEKEKEQF